VSTAIDLFGMKRGYVALFPGSGGALNLALMSNIGPDRPLVYADPGYEQGAAVADMLGAPKFAVKLTAAYAHDVRAMVAATPKAGVYYIVNPNNPTGTMTPKEDIVWLLKNKPAGSVVIVDEAYHDFSNAESCIDLVAADQDIIVTRTFSKIYGMAGLRCGFAVGRPDLLAKIQTFGANSMPILAVAAATSSLQVPELIPERRKINTDIRNDTFSWLAANHYKFIPSQTNCFMVDTGRPGKEVIAGMAAKNVYIGRVWPVWPTYVRVTVGTRSEMEKFQAAWKEVMSAPASASRPIRHETPTAARLGGRDLPPGMRDEFLS
jgi:histidinol-phosphate aminotransferase